MRALQDRGGRLVVHVVRLSPEERRWVGAQAILAFEGHWCDLTALRARASGELCVVLDAPIVEVQRRLAALRVLIPGARDDILRPTGLR